MSLLRSFNDLAMHRTLHFDFRRRNGSICRWLTWVGSIELEALLGVKVDVVTPNAWPEQFRATVLAEAKPI